MGPASELAVSLGSVSSRLEMAPTAFMTAAALCLLFSTSHADNAKHAVNSHTHFQDALGVTVQGHGSANNVHALATNDNHFDLSADSMEDYLAVEEFLPVETFVKTKQSSETQSGLNPDKNVVQSDRVDSDKHRTREPRPHTQEHADKVLKQTEKIEEIVKIPPTGVRQDKLVETYYPEETSQQNDKSYESGDATQTTQHIEDGPVSKNQMIASEANIIILKEKMGLVEGHQMSEKLKEQVKNVRFNGDIPDVSSTGKESVGTTVAVTSVLHDTRNNTEAIDVAIRDEVTTVTWEKDDTGVTSHNHDERHDMTSLSDVWGVTVYRHRRQAEDSTTTYSGSTTTDAESCASPLRPARRIESHVSSLCSGRIDSLPLRLVPSPQKVFGVPVDHFWPAHSCPGTAAADVPPMAFCSLDKGRASIADRLCVA